MQNQSKHVLAFIVAIAFGACDRKPVVVEPQSNETSSVEPIARTETFETARLDNAIDDFEKTPSAENSAAVKAAMAELDGEIAELEARVARASGGERDEAALKLRNLQTYRAAEQLRFTKAQTRSGAPPPPPADRSAESAEDRARKIGDAAEESAAKAADALKDTLDKAGDALRDRAP